MRRRPRPHGRPWSGAFNVVMATAIVSIACHGAGLDVPSEVLLWLALAAFAPLALLDVGRARHPLALLHRAGDPNQGFEAFGFVADTCVLGGRLIEGGGIGRTIAAVLLAGGGAVWIAIMIALVCERAARDLTVACGRWLLAVVATEGLAIGAGLLASAGWGEGLRVAGVALWAFGGVQYVVICAGLVDRLARRPLRAGELTPDWWIVMGAAAIFTVGATTVTRAAPGSTTGGLALAGWVLATVWIPVLVVAEVRQARRVAVPHFTPARWTMVFPLGMYSAAGQHIGAVLGVGWIASVGRWWLVVAIAAWVTVALGEVHHAFMSTE